jgi:hypothetical protein
MRILRYALSAAKAASAKVRSGEQIGLYIGKGFML